MAREEHESTLRRADAIDPGVRTDKQGYRLDDDGNRVDGGPTPPRPASAAHDGFGHQGATVADHADGLGDQDGMGGASPQARRLD